MVRVVCAVQVPRGCIFVYDEGSVPGGDVWTEASDEDFEKWKEATSRPRPGAG